MKISQELVELNIHRKEIEKSVIELVTREIQGFGDEFDNRSNNGNGKDESRNFIMYYSQDVHEGVMGIIAARVQEKIKKPCIIGSIVKTATGNILRASCRSRAPIDIGKIVIECVEKNLAIKGGGHMCAAGFTADESKISAIEKYIALRANEMLAEKEQLEEVKFVDYTISATGINEAFAKELSSLRPFGRDNESPLFMVQNISLLSFKVLHSEHIQFVFKCNSTGAPLRTICFRAVGTEIEQVLTMNQLARKLNIICNIEESSSLQYPKPNIMLQDVIIMD